MGSGFIGVDWEVGWGVMDIMLSLIAPEVTGVNQHCQKGVTGCNRPTVLSYYTSLICMSPTPALCNTSSPMVIYTPPHIPSDTHPNATTASFSTIFPNPEKHMQYVHAAPMCTKITPVNVPRMTPVMRQYHAITCQRDVPSALVPTQPLTENTPSTNPS